LGIGDWDWGLGPIPNPQSPIPKLYYLKVKLECKNNYYLI